MTLHAEEEMENDGFTIFDIEEAILTGRITERQRDRSTGESKYVVQGRTLSRDLACVVAKVGPTEKLVIIAVFAG
ncbi:MAG: DUF4258 domain-containing protein [Chitinivibrionales bacterium]|nr:DUF4258 domain-containing protein [Chitinivibrionales bacterium]